MPPKSTRAAKHKATDTNTDHPRRNRWDQGVYRHVPPAELASAAGVSKEGQRKTRKRTRSPSPEIKNVSTSTTSSSKRRRSTRLQAAISTEVEAAPTSQSVSSQIPGPSRPNTRNASRRDQGAGSRRDDDTPCRSTRGRPKPPASPLTEARRIPPRPLADKGVTPDIPPSHRYGTPLIEGKYFNTEFNNAPTSNAGSDVRTITTAANSNPDTAVPVPEPEVDYIDFGSLVPEGEFSKGEPIYLRFPDDGSSTRTLTVGRDEQCEIKFEDKKIGDRHCSLELILQCNRGDYKRIVRLSSIDPHKTIIIHPEDTPSQRQIILYEGSSVRFGASDEHQYRYALPQSAPPEPTCWATRLFTWNSKLEPHFGGSRSNSSVYLVKKRVSGTRHALKVIQTVRFSFNSTLPRMIQREREALSLLKHPHILGLQHFRDDKVHSRIIFVFPEMEGGNLFDLVVKNRGPQNQQFLNTIAPKVAKDLLCGLKYIHSKDIVHRDLKPENVFLAEKWSDGAQEPPKVVIGDFGIARLPGERRAETYDGGSNHWFSPISFRDPTEAETDFPIDLWGVALIIWFMLAGLPKPWGYAGAPMNVNEPNQLQWGWLEELNFTSECVNFLEGFLVDHPSRCRTIEGAENHSWIQNGVTVNPKAEGKNDECRAVVDRDIPPADDTQVGFDDEYY